MKPVSRKRTTTGEASRAPGGGRDLPLDALGEPVDGRREEPVGARLLGVSARGRRARAVTVILEAGR